MILKVFSTLRIPWIHDSVVVSERDEVSLKTLVRSRLPKALRSQCVRYCLLYVNLITIKHLLQITAPGFTRLFFLGFFFFVSLGVLCTYCLFVFLRNVVLYNKWLNLENYETAYK